MPVYNGDAYLEEAIASVLHQTFRDFECIIVNDGSTDGTGAILESYEKADPRIRIYHQENKGMIAALNLGCRAARGKYIARMDADDVCYPRRLEKQLQRIEQDPQVGVLGTWISNVRNGVAVGEWRPPTSSMMLKWTHFFGVCVSHPTVLIRREILEKLDFYREGTVHVEDVDLWLRASSITDFGNVPEVLLKYRTWPGNVTHTHREFARAAHVKLLASFIGDFLKITPRMEAVAGLRQSRVGPPPSTLRQIRLTADLLNLLYRAFLKNHEPDGDDRREISRDAAKRMGSLAIQASRIDARASVPLFLRALQLDPRLLSPSAIGKGLKRRVSSELDW